MTNSAEDVAHKNTPIASAIPIVRDVIFSIADKMLKALLILSCLKYEGSFQFYTNKYFSNIEKAS
jgi:hypothetical protein